MPTFDMAVNALFNQKHPDVNLEHEIQVRYACVRACVRACVTSAMRSIVEMKIVRQLTKFKK